MKKIKIKVKGQDYYSVLSSLGLLNKQDDEIKEVTLEIQETKENYKFLSTSDKVIDWDFVKETRLKQDGFSIPTIPFDCISGKKVLTKTIISWSDEREQIIELLKNTYPKHTGLELLGLLSSILDSRTVSPSMRFTKSLMEREIIPMATISKDVSPKIIIALSSLIDGFNNAFASSEDVISHFVDRLHEIWFSIEKDTTLVKFIEMFYGVHLGEML